ncbi:MAG: hypothetical protein J6B07_00095 [Opitutales bacterium]|nr:hypothetical protein [Opitutales bacterium]
MKKYSLAILAFVTATLAFAEIKMPAIFGHKMMFQQQQPINIWGTAKPNSEVKAMFNFKYTTTKADANGNWKMVLPAEHASFREFALVVYEDDIPNIEFTNILVGEVWIAGGQSNMEWKVERSSDKEIAKKNAKNLNGKMRYFMQSSNGYSKVEKDEFQKGAHWMSVNENNVCSTSAVGYYFAERLIEDLNVPVGIIYASKGATRMDCWTDKQTLLKGWGKDFAQVGGMIKTLENYTDAQYQKLLKAHKEKVAKHDAKVAKAKKEGKPIPTVAWDFRYPPSSESPEKDFRTPTIHFNGKIAPMRNFGVRGVLWYQGESDANGEFLKHYTESFGMLIDCWRKRLQNKNLPFIQVQLASYETKSDWAKAREAQYQNTKLYKNVYMAPIIDTGEEKNIHPHDKTTVGARMEKIALDKIYNRAEYASDFPVMKSVQFKGNEAVVSFNTFGRKLTGKGDARGFEILVDGKWQKANVILSGENVIAKVADDKTIAGVRYLWNNWISPQAWLFNGDGIPVIPFSTSK